MSIPNNYTHRQCLQVIHGIPTHSGCWVTEEKYDDALSYIPRDGDIIMAAYPKSGTHWLQYIVLQIVSKGEFYPPLGDTFLKVAPFLDIAGSAVVDDLKPPRIYKYHFAYDKVQKNPKSKVLYMYRKPEDIIVSMYHFMQEVYKSDFDFDEFFEDFMSGHATFGSYFDHLNSYFLHEGDDNLLLISYEELKANTKKGVLRIAKFLGEEYHQLLLEDLSLLEGILERVSFEYMQKNLVFDGTVLVEFDDRFPNVVKNFFRKGIVGDGKSLSEEKLERLRRKAENDLKGTKAFEKIFF